MDNIDPPSPPSPGPPVTIQLPLRYWIAISETLRSQANTHPITLRVAVNANEKLIKQLSELDQNILIEDFDKLPIFSSYSTLYIIGTILTIMIVLVVWIVFVTWIFSH